MENLTMKTKENTCILCIRLTEGVLFSHGTKYDIDFSDISCHTNKETLSN